MRNYIFFFITITLLISSCTSYNRYSIEELEGKKEELNKKRNHLIGEAYIKYSKEKETGINIFLIEGIRSMIEEDSTLKEFRRIFERESDKLDNFLYNTKSWQKLEALREEKGGWTNIVTEYRNEIFDSLRKSDGPYNKYMKDLQDSLKVSNRKILGHVLDNYKAEEKTIPVDWIPDDIMPELTQYPEVVAIEEEIQKVEEALKAKRNQQDPV